MMSVLSASTGLEAAVIRRLLLIVVSIAIVLGGSGVAVPAMANVGMEFSAAAKKSVSTRQRRDPGQIACTVSGCHRIPPGCHSETGYNWDGIPTGFDIVVCRYPRGCR